MDRQIASKLLREELNKHNLNDWKIRLVQHLDTQTFLGKCDYQEKCIYLNTFHVDTHPEPEIINTIRHEVAHALTPMHGHDEVWQQKAKEIGCDNVQPCGMALSGEIIDAMRSGHVIEVEFDEQVIRTPKYKVHVLRDKCPECGKIAEEISSEEFLGAMFIKLKCGHTIVKQFEPEKLTPYEKLITNDDESLCIHHWDKNRCTHCGEFRPFQYQVDGMRAIEKGLMLQRGFGVFDEQGLGKTPQALGVMKYHPEWCPFLLIGKSGLKFQYAAEIIRWNGNDFFPQIIETGKDGIVPNLKSYIIGYDMLRNFDKSKIINRAKIKTIILDECQAIKNPDSTRTTEVRELVKAIPDVKVLALSGTPWKNKGSELFVSLNLIDSTKFGSYKNFVNRWVDYYDDGGKFKEAGIRNIPAFKKYCEGLFIRRERVEVMPELPLISRNKFRTEIETDAKKEYDEAVDDFMKIINQHIIDGTEETFGASSSEVAAFQKMRHIIGWAKVPATLELLEEFLETTDRKIVVFVHHKDVGQLIFNQVPKLIAKLVKNKELENSIPVLELTAEKSADERFEICQQFNNAKRMVLIASTLASGEGLNLQTCSDCIMHERQWNPANEEQAEGRFIRIGQLANTVTATYVIADNTAIDYKLDVIVERKRRFFHATMNKSEMPAWNEKSLMKELRDEIIKEYNERRGK